MEHVLVLRPHLLKEADYQRKVFHVVLEAGTSLDDVLEPNFWVHNTSRLKPLQKVEVVAHDGSWYAELMVRSVSRAAAKVAVIVHKVLEDVAASAEDIGDHVIKHQATRGWFAQNKTTKAIVVDGLPDRESVVAFLRNPVKQAA